MELPRSVNGKNVEQIIEEARRYCCYETEEWISIDLGSLFPYAVDISLIIFTLGKCQYRQAPFLVDLTDNELFGLLRPKILLINLQILLPGQLCGRFL